MTLYECQIFKVKKKLCSLLLFLVAYSIMNIYVH